MVRKAGIGLPISVFAPELPAEWVIEVQKVESGHFVEGFGYRRCKAEYFNTKSAIEENAQPAT